ncbi:MAG: hypothetical protein B7Y56_03155 [Gallionellales bacterium 35-53-114]|jgi:hypothetical protein|nr:MAG: hypothetical protein B7Y56_03155 [Gallionellales bacterium 35-53-114]OYZ65106.1 MAG: hypothetical protein B7Y04_00315 [Gallionellales bacterium 24-53-125]OZB08015.1 MAG: hypothetical protein B7X61_10765 [Gallionellales bacterium 39-52-133]HQS59756.1 hypothetical protein [Gallionellaceae bacterium]HQS76510.1 hypothetical protein [Gallionellaceae bacterium]
MTTDETRFSTAQKLIKAAEHLDWLKNTAPTSDTLRAEIAESVEFLHDLAHKQAGDRASEIYKEGDPTPEEVTMFKQLLHAAGLGGASSITEDVCLGSTTSH